MPTATKLPPRRHRRAPCFAEGQAEPLHHELELALLFGRGCHGVPVELQHLDGWRRAWADFRAIVEPKRQTFLPGVRAFAAYVCGELEPPPVLREPPKCHKWFRVWIPGTGRFWTRFPEPWQRNETEWLVEIGEVQADELARHRDRIRQGPWPGRSAVWRMLCEYPLEAGRWL